jgi:hypothetical protein
MSGMTGERLLLRGLRPWVNAQPPHDTVDAPVLSLPTTTDAATVVLLPVRPSGVSSRRTARAARGDVGDRDRADAHHAAATSSVKGHGWANALVGLRARVYAAEQPVADPADDIPGPRVVPFTGQMSPTTPTAGPHSTQPSPMADRTTGRVPGDCKWMIKPRG